MPRFAANLTMMFTELPFLSRFAAAAEAGFDAVEFLFPYEFDKGELDSLLAANGLTLVLHNLPAGDWAAGERGIACHPDRVAEFRSGVERAIDYASALHCPKVNCLAGILPDGVAADAARATLIENLRYAASKLQAAGIGLLLASRAKTMESVSGLMNLVMLPMWVLSGVFFSASRFPAIIQPVVKALPLTAAIEAMRGNMLQGINLSQQTAQVAILLAWLVVPFVIALRIFRWR